MSGSLRIWRFIIFTIVIVIKVYIVSVTVDFSLSSRLMSSIMVVVGVSMMASMVVLVAAVEKVTRLLVTTLFHAMIVSIINFIVI